MGKESFYYFIETMMIYKVMASKKGNVVENEKMSIVWCFRFTWRSELYFGRIHTNIKAMQQWSDMRV